jgi:hypothetical protein
MKLIRLTMNLYKKREKTSVELNLILLELHLTLGDLKIQSI